MDAEDFELEKFMSTVLDMEDAYIDWVMDSDDVSLKEYVRKYHYEVWFRYLAWKATRR
jgi:hypothetical protein